MEDDYQNSNQIEEEEEEETTEQILEEIAEGDDIDDDDELLQQSLLPTKKHHDISIQSLDQIKEIISFNQYDLIDAKGGLDLVMVNGDQLIAHFLRDSFGRNESNESLYRLDWSKHGGQLLHLTYLVETFVKNLLDRDMRIDIVFFEDIRTSQCIKSSFLLNLAYEINQDLGISFQSLAYSFLVAKQAISSQLKKISETHYKSDVFTVTFLNDTWYKSSNWENLITKRKPSFIISTLAQNSHIDELFCTETVLVRQIIIAYDLCFYGNTVTGFCSAVRDNMTSSYKLREVELFLEKNFSEERSENMANLTSQIGLRVEKQLTEIKSNIEQIISKELSNTPLTNKISLSNLTLSTIASIDSLPEQTTPNSLALSKIFILTNIIQSIIPLKDRAQHIEDASLDSSLTSFQEKILTSLFHSLKQTNINDNLHDLLDFRLFLKVLTILLNTGVTQKLENNSSDDQILAELLPKEIQGLFKALASLLTTSKSTNDGTWWEKVLKPLVSTLNSSETEEYKPRHPECLLREVLPFSQDVINGLVSGINITLPHKYEKKIVEQAPVEEVKPVEEEADDDLEDWEKEDWLKDEEKVEEVVVEEEQEILTTEEAKELTFEKCFPVREQEVNYSQKKDIDEQIPNDFSGPKTEWEKIKVQEAQKRLHRYSESIRALSEKKVIETARSSGIVVEEAKPVEQTKGGKPTKPNKKEEKQATPTASAAPSTKVRLMMIESNTKKRDKEINELSGKLTEYQQKFNEYNNKADELKEHGGKIEQYESLTKLLLEGVFKDIRLVQNIQATEGGSSSNKKNASSGSESFTAALLLQDQRTTCENLWVQLSILRLQFMTRKLLLERQDLQTSLRRTQSSQKKKGVKFISFDEEPSDDKEEKKYDKKKGALKETNLNAVPQIDNLSGGADLDLSLYWEPFELTNRIYEIVTQLIGDAYISELTVATSVSQEKDKKPAKAAKKPVKGDKKAEKVKPVTKIDLKDVIQTLVNFMCDLGFVNFAKRISEKFNQGEITFGALIKDNLMQQLEVETLPAETVTVKDAVNDKPESAEFQLLYNNAIIESASNIEIPPAEIPETISIESKGAKPKGHPKKEKPSRTRKDEKVTEEESTTDEPSTPVSQNYVIPTAKTLGFTPDPWQEDMIVSILQNKSILVSAPTSSGKTFIAFFAMEKVLRESDDNIIVYCCPTKALVNQAYAEVYSRFQKVYSNTSPYGVSSMLGMYTSDEKINVTTCQVLITVPQSLEHLMTSPENLEWKRRMKYIILDEIHCINESSSSGQVWEHVLSLLECPFIALSASIGNPKEFAEWLNENYNKEIVSHINYLNDQQQGVDLVVHDERPRPLEFYNYDASSDRFTEIHPMATLNPNSIDTVSFSLIQNFSPLQCLSLFKVASSIRSSFKEQGKTISANVEKFLADFNPDSYFNNFGLFKRQQFSTYGKTMKEELIRLSTETDNHEFLLEIIRNLLKDVSLSFENMEKDYKTQIQQPISDNISESDAVSTSSDRVISRHKFGSDGWLKDNVIQLITRLAEQKLIPSIFFSFDRTMCDYLLKKISTHLRTARANSQLGNYFHLYSSSLEKVRSEKEIRYSLQSIEQFGTKIPLELREALEVGVAVHHHSCPSEYLTEVERLFRLRCLPVVISTSTLALGIHMPCKTVVMVGHSIYLTTTMFQQCAGRSGRRGYDVKGRVVLYGIPQVATNRLLAGVTPKIKGAMGLRANFLLKMLTILNKAKSDDTKYQIVSDDLGRLVNKKIFYLGQILENSELQNKLCFRFILDFLRRNSYISEDGTLGEFSLLSNSLFYYEPANFLFIHLLKTGAINTYLQKWKDILDESPIRPEEKVELLGEKLLILLNLLFETRKLSHWDLSPYKLENYYANDSLEIITSNKAALNANKNISSENVTSQLNDYNRIVLKEFATFAVTYCKNYQKETVDNVLPLSKISFPHEDSYLEQVYQESSLCKSLNESKLKYFGTSSFVAISGNDDVFTSVSQLLNCRNHNVILDVSLLPYIDLVEKISQKASLSISSYAVEFLRNGQKRQVSTDCDFPSLSLCFNSLKNFDRVLGQALYNIHLFMNIKNGANNDLFLATLTKLRTRFHDRVTGGKKTRKKLKMLKTINVEMDDLEMVNSKGKLKNSSKSTKKDAVTKETGALQE